MHRGYGDLYCIDEMFLQYKGTRALQTFSPAKVFWLHSNTDINIKSVFIAMREGVQCHVP